MAVTSSQDPRLPFALLLGACLTTFAITSSGSARSPFILEMARELQSSIPHIANLFGLTSFSWGISSYLAGRWSDRFGRRPFLLLGPFALAVCLILVATSTSYFWLAIWVTLAGACSGTYTGVSMAEVASRVPDHRRGQALGWVMGGQSLNLLIGIPAAAWIGASIGWRGVHYCICALVLACLLITWLTTRSKPRLANAPRPAVQVGDDSRAKTRIWTAPVLALMFIVVAERICFGIAAVYYPTFLQLTHELSLRAIALPLAVFALGNIIGTAIGAKLADRPTRRRAVFVFAMTASAAFAVMLFGWSSQLYATVAFGFGYALANAICRPSLMSLIAGVPSDIRGGVMGLMGTFASIGWLAAAALGGWLMTAVGFESYGPLIVFMAVFSVIVIWRGPMLPATR